MVVELCPVVVDVLWHPLIPSGTGNRQRILKLSEYAQGVDLFHVGPGPIPDGLPNIRYEKVRQSPLLPVTLGFNREILGYMTPQATRRLARSVRRLSPDVIMAEGLWAVPGASAAARTSGVPMIITVNNLEYRVLEQRRRMLASRAVARLERRYYRKADHLIAVSDIDRERLGDLLGGACPPVTVVPNGIDPPKTLPRPAEIPHPNVLFLGKTDYPPNRVAIETLISEWVPTVHAHGMEIHPVVVGGPDPPRKERGVLFTGYVDSIWPYLAAADFCVAPLSAGSGTRIKILSYLAAGKPTIATGIAVEGLGLRDGDQYLRADSSVEFRTALQRLFSDGELCSHLATRGKATASRFHWRTISEQWSTTIRQIAAGIECG